MKRWILRGWGLFVVLCLSVGSLGCLYHHDDDNNDQGVTLLPILALGGRGDVGPGGGGGVVTVQGNTIDSQGNITIKAKGRAHAGFVVPPQPDFDLGYYPWVVGRDTTVEVYGDTADADANAQVGERLLILGDDLIYEKMGTSNYQMITGLKIKKGATLTLGMNYNYGGAAAEDEAAIWLDYDLVINGKMTVKPLSTAGLSGNTLETRAGAPATDRDMPFLDLSAQRILINGTIDTSGKDATVDGDRGGYGGTVRCHAYNVLYLSGRVNVSGGDGLGAGDGGDASWRSDSQSASYFDSIGSSNVITGAIDATGGKGANGGDGGGVEPFPLANSYVTGLIDASGGRGRNGNGGDAGHVSIFSTIGSVHNRGHFLANGGDAYSSSFGVVGGHGGSISLYGPIDVKNSGRIEADGGSGAESDGGNGGDGGAVLLQASAKDSSELDNTGGLFARGGDGSGAMTVGGAGGSIYLLGIGRVTNRSRLNSSGGSADMGGPGGSINIEGEELNLFGVSRVDVSGGAGAQGGSAGNLNINKSDDISIHRKLVVNGGPGSTGSGGYAGMININSFQGSVVVGADLAAKGGVGVNEAGGFGGMIMMTALGDVLYRGVVNMYGGDATGAGSFNGGSGQVFFLLGDNVTFNGLIRGRGGRGLGAGIGGTGATVLLQATTLAKVKGDFRLPGGPADALSGMGGVGGTLTLTSGVGPTQYQMKYNVAGGDGATPGASGTASVDGVPLP